MCVCVYMYVCVCVCVCVVMCVSWDLFVIVTQSVLLCTGRSSTRCLANQPLLIHQYMYMYIVTASSGFYSMYCFACSIYNTL